MADVSHKRIDELDTISGILKGISLRRVGGDLGVTAFGISISEMEPGATDYPEHDHSPSGIGGKMFAKRPEQLGQEEVYVALSGSGTIVVDGEELPLDGEHIVRVGPDVTRSIKPGPEGLRLLAIGSIPGRPYGTGGSL